MSANGTDRFLNIEDANLRVRSGNVHAKGITVGGITVGASHGLQSVSNVSNTTSNTLQFTNATTAFRATSNIEVGGNVSYTSKPQISVESNVVAEYTGPHDRPLRKYPEVAMTQNDESATSGYVASASSTATYNTDIQPENAFNGVISPSSGTAAWQSSDSGYSGTTPFDYLNSGTHTKFLTDTDETIHRGDWLSLQTPNKIKVSYYKIHTLDDVDNYRPDSFVLLGSNSETDGTWKLLHTETSGMSDPGPEVYTGHVNSTEFYKYHRLLVKSLTGSGGEIYLNELAFYGHEEGDSSLDTTLKSVYNVPGTQQLEVYYDGRETSSYPESGVTVTDISPNTNNGTLNGGVGFDSTYKAFTFNGTTTRNITATLPSSVTGEYVHSVSLWVKADEVSRTSSGMFTFFTIGSASGTNMIALGVNTNVDGIKYDFFDSGAHVNSPPITSNEWMHFVVTYSGGANNLTGAKRVYLNGKELVISEYGGNSVSSPLSLPTSPTLTIGGQLNSSNPPFSGSIANFRLFSKALNADQVKELYDYQKDYFLGSKSQVTLYKGHLGIGVAEPSGQLELAGDERIQEYPPRAMTGYENYFDGHGAFYASWSSNPAGDAHFWYGWQVFDGDPTTNINLWHSDGGYSTSGTYAATSTRSLGGYQGDWVRLDMPYKIKLTSFRLRGRDGVPTQSPKSFVIIGSNTGNEWDVVFTTGDAALVNNVSKNFTVNSTKYYKYYALVVMSIAGNYSGVGVSELKFFGTPGPTTLDKGSLTLGRSLDVPRISRYDVDTETPRPEKLVVDFDTTVNSSPTDISGQGNHGTFYNGASYSAADKAFTFVGSSSTGVDSSDKIQSTYNWGSTAPAHTFSVWFKRTANLADWEWICSFGQANNTGGNPGILMSGDTYSGGANLISFDTFNDQVITTYAVPLGVWTHVVATFNAASTAWSPDNCKIYVNGVLTPGTNASVGNLNVVGNEITLGATHEGKRGFTGQISNFKLYSVALEASEVRKLYNLGRTGRSMVISDTAVGIGKVPEAQLDVRGNINSDGIMTNKNYMFFATGPATAMLQPGVEFGNDLVANFSRIEFILGSGFDTSTKTYTIPCSGYWEFSYCLLARNKAAGAHWVMGRWLINGVLYDNRTFVYFKGNTDGAQESDLIGKIIGYYTAGTTISVRISQNTVGTDVYMSSNYSHFFGKLLH